MLGRILKKLAFQFAIVMAVIAATPLVLVSTNLIGINRTAVESSTMELYSSTAKMAALEVDFYVQSKQEPAEELAASLDLSTGGLTHESVAALEEFFARDASVVSAAVYGESGAEIFSFVRGETSMSRAGAPIDDAEFAEALKGYSGSIFWKDEMLELITYTHIPERMVLITVNYATKLEGVLDRHRFGRSGAACLIDGSGRGLYKPGYDDLPYDLAEYSEAKQIMGLVENRVYGTSEGTTADGRRVLIAFAPTTNYSGGVIIHQLYEDAYRSSILLSRVSITGVVAGVVAAVIIAVVFSVYMTLPIRRLAEAARRVTRGDFEARIKTRRRDELGAFIQTFNEMVESLGETETLRELAIRDGLTGLYNRREMENVLEKEVDRYRRYGHPTTLVMMDIDRFKKINDKYGHQVGDKVLRWIAHNLRENVRRLDLTVRYGGEEFAIIMPNQTAAEGLRTAERLRKIIATFPIVLVQDSDRTIQIPITISSGVAGIPGDAEAEEELVKAADEALYEAKKKGRNRTILFADIRTEEASISAAGKS